MGVLLGMKKMKIKAIYLARYFSFFPCFSLFNPISLIIFTPKKGGGKLFGYFFLSKLTIPITMATAIRIASIMSIVVYSGITTGSGSGYAGI